jgi:calcineurin-like phosphoesterase family protein
MLGETPNLREVEVIEFGKILQTEINGIRTIITHLPWYGKDVYDTRYDELKPKREDWVKTFLLCGHSHLPPEKKVGRNSLDVGVDGNGWEPYSYEDIVQYIKLS